MTATALAFGYDAGEMKILRSACGRLNVRVRRALPEEQGQPIGAFFGLVPRTEAAEAADIPGRMLVLAGLTDRQTDGLLSALRTARAGYSLKAVLTEHNARWTAPALYAALARERASLEDRERGQREG